MRITKVLVGLVAFAAVAAPLKAQGTFKVADNSSSGTYAKMLGDIIGVCNDDNFSIVEAGGVTGGAPGNLQALVDNKAQAAFLHSDVFFAQSQSDPTYNRFQTLVALYPEPIHILALRESKTSKQGLSFGKQEFTNLSSLRGFKVGAAGGDVFTGRILQGQGQAGFITVPYNTGDELIAALNNGDVSAAIFVGAAPLPNIEKLDKMKYKLLPIDDAVKNNVKGVYREVAINYPGMTNGPVHTMAPIATLLTRKYSGEAAVSAQRHFRECFYKHLDDLQDNGAPNWQQVDANDHGVLTWYDIPGSTSPTKKKD